MARTHAHTADTVDTADAEVAAGLPVEQPALVSLNDPAAAVIDPRTAQKAYELIDTSGHRAYVW